MVDAVMAEEGLVLGRDERLDQELGIFGIAQLHAAFARIAVDRQPVDRADIGRQRRLVALERVDRGQVARDEQPGRGTANRPPSRASAREDPADATSGSGTRSNSP